MNTAIRGMAACAVILAMVGIGLLTPARAQTWNIQTIDSSGDVGSYSSLVLDALRHPHISYYDYT
ncbi:MAG: hypothetical protein MUE60_16190, partial [Candidatus Eisenbacteria bacterium]|nr:hypothetical protein [Candidatus Eisenbacteria bacterium]